SAPRLRSAVACWPSVRPTRSSPRLTTRSPRSAWSPVGSGCSQPARSDRCALPALAPVTRDVRAGLRRQVVVAAPGKHDVLGAIDVRRHGRQRRRAVVAGRDHAVVTLRAGLAAVVGAVLAGHAGAVVVDAAVTA